MKIEIKAMKVGDVVEFSESARKAFPRAKYKRGVVTSRSKLNPRYIEVSTGPKNKTELWDSSFWQVVEDPKLPPGEDLK